MNVVIVIPTFNERDNIRPLLTGIFELMPEITVFVVDDNSPDGTGAMVQDLSKKNARIRVLLREKKQGLGRAYIAGFKEALKLRPDYVLQMDADLSHDPKYIPLFLKELASCDVVLGSRFLNVKFPPHVSLLSVVASRYTKWMLGLKSTDCSGGFKGFRKNVLEELDLDKFISKGFVFQAEFLFRTLKKGFVLREIPIVFRPRKSGTSKKSVKVILEALLKIPLLAMSR